MIKRCPAGKKKALARQSAGKKTACRKIRVASEYVREAFNPLLAEIKKPPRSVVETRTGAVNVWQYV